MASVLGGEGYMETSIDIKRTCYYNHLELTLPPI